MSKIANLVLNEEQEMLQNAAREYFSEAASIEAFRKVRDEQGVVRADREVWQAMVDMGWSSILVPEELDGLDFGLMGMGVLCIEAAKSLAASPLQSSAALSIEALLMCEASEERDALISAIASGDELAITCLTDKSRFVAEGTTADKALVLIDQKGVQALQVIELNTDDIERTPRKLIDFRDYAQMDLSAAPVKLSLTVEHGVDFETRINNIGAALTACEQFGISSEVFERTIAYISERKQFGQEIGSFQAIQHRMAHLYMKLQMLKSVLYDALSALEVSRDDVDLAVSHAKVLGNDVSQAVCTEGIQLHGGMGITDELDIGLFYKRARVLRGVFGSSSVHRERFAQVSGM